MEFVQPKHFFQVDSPKCLIKQLMEDCVSKAGCISLSISHALPESDVFHQDMGSMFTPPLNLCAEHSVYFLEDSRSDTT